MRELLYDVQWQVLRMTCCERYHHAGGWATVEGTTDNLNKLAAYLDEVDLVEKAVRQFRVNQYLIWIEVLHRRHGHLELYAMVAAFRNTYVRDYDVLLVRKAAETWNWQDVIFDLVRLRNKDEEMFVTLYAYLTRRTRSRYKKPQQAKEVNQFVMFMERLLWPKT